MRENRGVTQQAGTAGVELARALAVKDYRRLGELMDPRIDFRAMTPRRSWEASEAEEVVSGVLRRWFEESDRIEGLDGLESDSVADRERVGHRFRVRNPEGRFLVDQQADLAALEGRIVWMRVLCSGFRPDP